MTRKRYTKADVSTHEERYYGPQLPAVNVKAYHTPDAYDVMDAFECDKDTAERATEFAFESAQALFWEDARMLADELLAPHFGSVTVYSAGRSGGWLIVDGLPDLESWDAIDLAKWRKFEIAVNETVDWACSWENWKDNIEANRWAEPGAALLNFYEFADGHSECLVDLKANGRACPDCGKILALAS